MGEPQLRRRPSYDRTRVEVFQNEPQHDREPRLLACLHLHLARHARCCARGDGTAPPRRVKGTDLAGVHNPTRRSVQRRWVGIASAKTPEPEVLQEATGRPAFRYWMVAA